MVLFANEERWGANRWPAKWVLQVVAAVRCGVNNEMKQQNSLTGLYSLVTLAATGDANAFGELVRRFQDMAVGYASALLRDRDMAEDAAQEAFVAAWQALPQLRQPEAFPGWLKTIVFKQCDRIKRRARVEMVSLDTATELPAPAEDPSLAAETVEQRRDIAAAIAGLPERERVVVLLYYFGEHSLPVIGRFLDVPATTVKSRLFSARQRLKETMIPMLEEELTEQRPSRDAKFTERVISLIRPHDSEMDTNAPKGCSGADIWAMMCAALTGDVGQIKRLLKKSPDLAHAEYWYTQPLHYAVREGHLKAVRTLLDAGADPTAVRYAGEELATVARDRGHEKVAQLIERTRAQRLDGAPSTHEIHAAAAAGDLDVVRGIVEADTALLHLADPQGFTPLHHAVTSGRLDLVEYLLAKGARIEGVAGTGGTYHASDFKPIDLAIWRSPCWIGPRADWRMVGYLIARGAQYGTAIAAAAGDMSRVCTLLEDDPARANEAQSCGKRPLSAAIQFGHDDIARLLLERGADPNLPEGRFTPRGSALYFAATNNNYEMAKLLLKRGADPNGPGIDSCGTVYHVADKEMRLLLYGYGLQTSEFDLDNYDALAVYADKDPEGLSRAGCGTVFTMVTLNYAPNGMTEELLAKKESLLRMLLAKGVRVPPVVTGCRTYLWHIPKFTRILLEHGMDPNLPNWQRVTPLHDMCDTPRGKANENHIELAEMFLEFGADINARDEEYRSTPLAWAARCGLPDMVEFLLARGAKTNLPDDEPWATPLSWAEKRGHNNIADILRKRGASA